ncbi:Hypothetical protein VS_II1253 [Vibrio atlanticus]|uniref:Uncharacterized protein n=1 Tax=Vibrio atlanticus (strain LGP32) TaxID=575788 RepID=B7VT01_VIBA3|nr:Hypothetical protein VS_II1253 [Vibrio atlanticus]
MKSFQVENQILIQRLGSFFSTISAVALPSAEQHETVTCGSSFLESQQDVSFAITGAGSPHALVPHEDSALAVAAFLGVESPQLVPQLEAEPVDSYASGLT